MGKARIYPYLHLPGFPKPCELGPKLPFPSQTFRAACPQAPACCFPCFWRGGGGGSRDLPPPPRPSLAPCPPSPLPDGLCGSLSGIQNTSNWALPPLFQQPPCPAQRLSALISSLCPRHLRSASGAASAPSPLGSRSPSPLEPGSLA